MLTREQFNETASAFFISYEQYVAEVKWAEQWRASEIAKSKQRMIDAGAPEDFAEDMATKIFDGMMKAYMDKQDEYFLTGKLK